ncbi:unnamed protein product [Cylicocyclus nassatus]|uniref:Uncharacterized protein n=1 Tax=Cylicocyclus nassatus TaxID=53992 RepID=A0AA36HBH9_CYLNA|nr:unnamed protein product [Cylicocyclus nassatus]
MSFIDAGADQGKRFCNVDFEDNEIIDVTEETQVVEVTETVGTTINNANAINTITSPFSQASPLLQTLALDHLQKSHLQKSQEENRIKEKILLINLGQSSKIWSRQTDLKHSAIQEIRMARK